MRSEVSAQIVKDWIQLSSLTERRDHDWKWWWNHYEDDDWAWFSDFEEYRQAQDLKAKSESDVCLHSWLSEQQSSVQIFERESNSSNADKHWDTSQVKCQCYNLWCLKLS